MNYISDILYWISTGLLVPVIVLLIFFFGRSLLLIGSFFGQYLASAARSRSSDANWMGSLRRRLPHLPSTFPKRIRHWWWST